MASRNYSRNSHWATPALHRRSARATLRVCAVVAPLVLVPILFGSTASAGPSLAKTACVHGVLGGVGGLTVGASATVTVNLLESSCATQVVSLVAYQTEGPDYNSAGTQARFDLTTASVTAAPRALQVSVPDCFFQVDVIYGADAPAVLHDQELYYTHHGTLLASYNGGSQTCSTAPSVSPTVVSTSPSVAIDEQSSSKPPTESSSPPSSSVQGVAISGTPTPSEDFVVSPSAKASVLGEFFTASPAGSVLPFTGVQMFALVALGLGLLICGTAIATVLRRRLAASHEAAHPGVHR